jgi:hypothetical protein
MRLDSQHKEVFVDLDVLKKKISSYRTEGGHLKKVPDELAIEILMAWENWTGPAKGFYTAIGVTQYKMASVLGRAKRLKREGHFPVDEFKEVKVADGSGPVPPCSGIEIAWDGNRLIRFTEVDQLVDFLKKVA